MINEHKAHASFVLKVINVVIGCGFVLVLAVIIYDMFFHISNDLIIAYELIIVPSFSLLTYVLFGIAYKEITKLTNYDKHKLICEFVRDTTISAISNELTIIGTMTLYQLQNPINPLVFIVLSLEPLSYTTTSSKSFNESNVCLMVASLSLAIITMLIFSILYPYH
jgi:hypothetical protein